MYTMSDSKLKRHRHVVCWYCKNKGHFKRNCFIFKKIQLAKAKTNLEQETTSLATLRLQPITMTSDQLNSNVVVTEIPAFELPTQTSRMLVMPLPENCQWDCAYQQNMISPKLQITIQLSNMPPQTTAKIYQLKIPPSYQN